MPDPTPEHVLAEWQQLADEATAGPWRVQECPESVAEAIAVAWDVEGAGGVDVALDLDRPDDAVFIAAARTAVPALIAEVRRLQEEVREHQDQDAAITTVQEDARRLHADLLLHRAQTKVLLARMEGLAARLWRSRRRWMDDAQAWRHTHTVWRDKARDHEARAVELTMTLTARDKALARVDAALNALARDAAALALVPEATALRDALDHAHHTIRTALKGAPQ